MSDKGRNSPGAEPRLKTIDSNVIDIERGTLRAGGVSFQISNIASLEVEPTKTLRFPSPVMSMVKAVGGFFILGFIAAIIIEKMSGSTQLGTLGFWTSTGIGIAIAAFMAHAAAPTKLPAELRLLTNAASSFRILDKDMRFLIRLKSAIEDAMHVEDNSVSYHIEKVEQKIDRVVSASGPGSIAAGGDIRDSKISINATVQGLQDIGQLMGIVEKLAGVNAAALKTQLEIVQSYLAGGAKTKVEAKSAWAKFAEHVGTVAKAGTNVLELVARIAAVLA